MATLLTRANRLGVAFLTLFALFVLPAHAADSSASFADAPEDTLEYWLGPDSDFEKDPWTWRFNTGLEFSRGDYGGEDASEAWVQSVSAGLTYAGWTVGASTSYQRFTGTALDLSIFQDAIAFEDALFTGDFFTRQTIKGLGDTTVSLRYDFDDLVLSRWFLSTGVRVKLPTASRMKGLGSGHTDVTVDADAIGLFSGWSAFLYGGITMRGETSALPRQNTAQFSVGADTRLAARWNAGATYNWRELSFGGRTSDVSLHTRFRLTDAMSMTGYATFGLDRNSPDLAVGVRVGWRGTW